MSLRQISLRGVEVHNLKGIDLDLPHRALIAIVGVSGSGKTSLALDTLYAEGQRRYIETFSASTRQFLERLEKPDADRIDGLPPAISVSRTPSPSPRATVATATEVADYLRLLFAKLGRVYCLRCGHEVRRESPEQAARVLAALPVGTRFLVAFAHPREESHADQPVLANDRMTWKEAGFVRAIVGERLISFDGLSPADPVATTAETYIVVDRLSAGGATSDRLRDSLESAFWHGHGAAFAFVEENANVAATLQRGTPYTLDGHSWRRLGFSAALRCEDCRLAYPEPAPQLFNFNSPLGACPACEGSGIDPNQATGVCADCHGARLRPEALAVRFVGKSFAEIGALKIGAVAALFRDLPLTDADLAVSGRLLEQIRTRLNYLEAAGLEYLTLGRSLTTLSAGEARRVELATALGSSLVGVLYVLDEPSAGVHPSNLGALINCLRQLRDRGNTVVVVEHDEQLIRAANVVVELGPGAGERGGEVVFQGTPLEMQNDVRSLTGDYLAGRRGSSVSSSRRPTTHGRIRVTNARGNNLQNVSADFPLGVLCVVTGVSGSGKSTLVRDTLYPAICQRLKIEAPTPLAYDDVFGDGQIESVVLVDQTPVGRSPRSNPVTYIKAFDEIRAVFAETLEARTHNFTASHFSFNVTGGRCPECEGEGFRQIDMQFLPDVFMKCPVCHGRRYRKEILQVKHRGRNIADVLDMTVREAFTFFRGSTKAQSRLKHLIDVGLDYLRLGQPANTLSGGEAQRLKLAGCLASPRRGRTLFILDEPTTGLHFADIARLLDCLDSLLAVGHSILVVEHNLQMMKAADQIVDLGPGAAEEGGRIVVSGTPEAVAEHSASATGRALAAAFAQATQISEGAGLPSSSEGVS